MNTRILIALSAALAHCLPVATADDGWKDRLEAALTNDVQLTKTSYKGYVSAVGSKFTLKTENIQAMPSDSPTPTIDVIENGQRKEAGRGTRLGLGILNGARRNEAAQIDPGSQIGITKLKVDNKAVLVQVITLKGEKVTVDGNTQARYYFAILQFPFSDLSTMNPDTVRRTIWQTLAPEDPGLQSATKPSSVVVAPGTAGAGGVNRISVSGSETSSREPAKAGFNTLVGKEVVDLIDLLGPPDSKVEAGDTTIYVYKGLQKRFGVKDGVVVSAQ